MGESYNLKKGRRRKVSTAHPDYNNLVNDVPAAANHRPALERRDYRLNDVVSSLKPSCSPSSQVVSFFLPQLMFQSFNSPGNSPKKKTVRLHLVH